MYFINSRGGCLLTNYVFDSRWRFGGPHIGLRASIKANETSHF